MISLSASRCGEDREIRLERVGRVNGVSGGGGRGKLRDEKKGLSRPVFLLPDLVSIRFDVMPPIREKWSWSMTGTPAGPPSHYSHLLFSARSFAMTRVALGDRQLSLSLRILSQWANRQGLPV